MRGGNPPQQDLVLVGGGHSHVLVLRRLAMQAPAGLRITLISPAAFTPYSGMLPGLLAGHYRFEETHIDLARLCQWAGVRFLADTVESLDPERQVLRCRIRGEVAYDLLSLDIGSQPELDSVPGARQYAVPVKPVAGFWARWKQVSRDQDLAGQRIAVVGGGAGSVEIALAIAHRLSKSAPSLALYCGGPELLAGSARGVRRKVERQLEQLGVALHCDHRVDRVETGTLHFESAPPQQFDTLFWCTGAAPAPWIAASGLPVDERGFMRVEDTLQSTGFANVFGAGDIATQYRHPRPKAGVYAVRQGPVLAANLAALSGGRALREHRPQQRFLSLLSLGPREAVAERNGLSVRGAWVWRWKDHIDRKFMRRFSDLPKQDMSAPVSNELQAPCGGCGAKIAADGLHAVLNELRGRFPDAVATMDDADDAAPLIADSPVMQSLDALRTLVDDPWRMGRIAAQHALSDLYASGARPHSALALVTLPFAAPALLTRDLLSVLEGALSVFQPAGCRLQGGHSMQGPELQLGFAVNGVLDGQAPLSRRGAAPGDRILLTRALGSGALFAAHMQARADGRHVEKALTLMEAGNAAAANVAREFGARAVTDVTGFGLAGHLFEMLGDALAASIDLARLPLLPGAIEAMQAGIYSTLQEPNRRSLEPRWALPSSAPLHAQILFDPQTSGGLLLALPAETADAACARLCESGHDAALIGEFLSRTPERPLLDLRY